MSRFSNKSLAGLSRRLSTALGAGVDLRGMLAQEAQRAPWGEREPLRALANAAARGQSLGDSVESAGDAFPALFCQLVQLGDQTGRLPEVFARLADHYEHRVRLRRQFLAGMTRPLLQLAAAVAVVGFLIWIMGTLGQSSDGKPNDLLGLGLMGNRGLAIYCVIVAAIAAGFVALVRLLCSEVVWTGPLQQFLYRMPVLGNVLSNVALTRLTWALGMALEAGMEVKTALKMGLRSTHSAVFTNQIAAAEKKIDQRQSIHDALAACGVLPAELLHTVDVGEQSGTLPEVLLRLSDDYQDRSLAAMKTLAVVGGFLVWGIVAIIIISLIFRIFVHGYLGAIYDAMKPN